MRNLHRSSLIPLIHNVEKWELFGCYHLCFPEDSNDQQHWASFHSGVIKSWMQAQAQIFAHLKMSLGRVKSLLGLPLHTWSVLRSNAHEPCEGFMGPCLYCRTRNTNLSPDAHPKYGPHHSMDWGSRPNKREKGSWQWPSSLSASWWQVYCDHLQDPDAVMMASALKHEPQ